MPEPGSVHLDTMETGPSITEQQEIRIRGDFSLEIVSGTRAIFPRRLNKAFRVKVNDGYPDRQAPPHCYKRSKR